MYDEKLLGTVAFSNGCLCSKKLTQREHRHFHPSGLPIPSREDFDVCRRMKEAGVLIGIELLDFIVIGSNDFSSFREKELL